MDREQLAGRSQPRITRSGTNCLSFYERPTAMVQAALCDAYASDKFLWSVPVVAWSVLAMSPTRHWLEASAPITMQNYELAKRLNF